MEFCRMGREVHYNMRADGGGGGRGCCYKIHTRSQGGGGGGRFEGFVRPPSPFEN